MIAFSADPTSGDALVRYDSEKVTFRDVVKAVRNAGYDVVKNSLYVVAELGEEEVTAFEDFAARLDGVIECRVSPITGLASIVYNPLATSKDELVEAIRRKYPKAREASEESISPKEAGGRWELPVRLASFIIGLTSVAYHTAGTFFGGTLPFWDFRDYLLFTAATAVISMCKGILLRGIKSLMRASPTMDSLVAVSALTSYFFSINVMLGVITVGEPFFEASAGVLGFVSAGRYLEGRLRSRANEALSKLVELHGGKVKVVRGVTVEEVSVDEVRPGDVVEVKAGERVHVDGVVVEGEGYVDESTFTGEHMPRLKSFERRDPVLAGTFLTSGFIRVRVTRVGKDTSLAYVIRAVKESQFHKPRFQRVADRVAGTLTWVVLALSVATFLYWFVIGDVGLSKSVLFAVAVLVVACPCPLGIAIPMVVSVAAVRAARSGILIRSGEVFERLLSVDTVLIDKTGTLTVGEPALHEVITLNRFSSYEVLKYVCAAEVRSEHPLAKAVMKKCSDSELNDVNVEGFEHLPGLGIIARVNGREVAVGSEKLMRGLGVGIDASTYEVLKKMTSDGFTAVLVSLDRELAAVLKVGDAVRDEAAEVVRYFKELGLKTALVTGDSRLVGEAIARLVGVDSAYSELSPEDKAELVEEFQARGSKVMFVGDGINDAAAIGRAFVGVAMGGGADVSREAGDVVIINNDLTSLTDAYRLSQKVRRKAIENLVWAFAYNLMLIPIAMGALYRPLGLVLRPEVAAAAMMLSDISVVINALTLTRWRPRERGTRN